MGLFVHLSMQGMKATYSARCKKYFVIQVSDA